MGTLFPAASISWDRINLSVLWRYAGTYIWQAGSHADSPMQVDFEEFEAFLLQFAR
jgi:hypothetical protein